MTGSDAEPLLDQLIDVGNKALADHYHEDLCSCSTWPDACASGLKPFTWDTNAFAIALPAILAAYEKQRTTDQPPAPADPFAAFRTSIERLTEQASRVMAAGTVSLNAALEDPE